MGLGAGRGRELGLISQVGGRGCEGLGGLETVGCHVMFEA